MSDLVFDPLDYENNFTAAVRRLSDTKGNHVEAFNHAPSLRYVVSNGITLCNWCHDDFHNKYGRRLNTGKQLEEWLQDTKVS